MTKSRMTAIIPYLNKLKQTYPVLNILETGTIRNTAAEYVTGDGHSTVHIAEWVKLHGGRFTSIDLYTGVADRYLSELGLRDNVTLVQSNSLLAIAAVTTPLHFVLLDSANNADLILAEFRLVAPKVVKGGIVMIDDVNMTSVSIVKGHKVVPYAREQGYTVELLPAGLAVVSF